MQSQATQPKATRTVKIGDNHHRLLRILASMMKVTQQEAFEICVEETLSDFLEGVPMPRAPLRDWEPTLQPASDAANLSH